MLTRQLKKKIVHLNSFLDLNFLILFTQTKNKNINSILRFKRKGSKWGKTNYKRGLSINNNKNNNNKYKIIKNDIYTIPNKIELAVVKNEKQF